MLEVAARIPDAAARDQFADRLSHKAQITEEVVRAEIRKAAVQKKTTAPELERPAPGLGQVKTVERGLIWALMRDPEAGAGGAGGAGTGRYRTAWRHGPILEQARSLQEWPPRRLPETLIERLNSGEASLVAEIGRQSHPPAAAADCVRTLKRLRFDRERAAVQREIDRLQEQGAARHEDGNRLAVVSEAVAAAADRGVDGSRMRPPVDTVVRIGRGLRDDRAERRRTCRCRSKKNTMK